MSFLKGSIKGVLTLEANGTNTLTWYIDVALTVYADMKSNTAALYTMVKLAIISSSTKK